MVGGLEGRRHGGVRCGSPGDRSRDEEGGWSSEIRVAGAAGKREVCGVTRRTTFRREWGGELLSVLSLAAVMR